MIQWSIFQVHILFFNLPLFGWWPQGKKRRICGYGVFCYCVFKSSSVVGDVLVCPVESFHQCVDRFGPLLPHQPCTNMEASQPWDGMVLKDVHFWQNASPGEFLPVECHKIFDVLFCNGERVSYCRPNPHFNLPTVSISLSVIYLAELTPL